MLAPRRTNETPFSGVQGKAPWQFSWQKNERNLTFDDPLKIRMIKGFAAKELGIEGEVRGRPYCSHLSFYLLYHIPIHLSAVQDI